MSTDLFKEGLELLEDIKSQMEEQAPTSEFLQKFASVMKEKYSSMFKVTTSPKRVTLMVTAKGKRLVKVYVSQQASGKIGVLWHYQDRTRTKSNFKADMPKVVSSIVKMANSPS